MYKSLVWHTKLEANDGLRVVPGPHASRLLAQGVLMRASWLSAEPGHRSSVLQSISALMETDWDWVGVSVGSCKAWNYAHIWGWTSIAWNRNQIISLQNRLLEFLRRVYFHTLNLEATLWSPFILCITVFFPLASLELGRRGLCFQLLIWGTCCFLCKQFGLALY